MPSNKIQSIFDNQPTSTKCSIVVISKKHFSITTNNFRIITKELSFIVNKADNTIKMHDGDLINRKVKFEDIENSGSYSNCEEFVDGLLMSMNKMESGEEFTKNEFNLIDPYPIYLTKEDANKLFLSNTNIDKVINDRFNEQYKKLFNALPINNIEEMIANYNQTTLNIAKKLGKKIDETLILTKRNNTKRGVVSGKLFEELYSEIENLDLGKIPQGDDHFILTKNEKDWVYKNSNFDIDKFIKVVDGIKTTLLTMDKSIDRELKVLSNAINERKIIESIAFEYESMRDRNRFSDTHKNKLESTPIINIIDKKGKNVNELLQLSDRFEAKNGRFTFNHFEHFLNIKSIHIQPLGNFQFEIIEDINTLKVLFYESVDRTFSSKMVQTSKNVKFFMTIIGTSKKIN